MVRQVARLAPEDKRNSCIAQGVEVLERSVRSGRSVPLRAASEFLCNNRLCVLSSDKDGGFAVFPNDVFRAKAAEATNCNFNRVDQVRPKKAKAVAMKLCKRLGILSLVKQIQEMKKPCLDVSFGTDS